MHGPKNRGRDPGEPQRLLRLTGDGIQVDSCFTLGGCDFAPRPGRSSRVKCFRERFTSASKTEAGSARRRRATLTSRRWHAAQAHPAALSRRGADRPEATNRQRPFFIGGDRHGTALRVLAPQRGLRCIGNLLWMGLFLRSAALPTPRSFHHSDYGLPAGMDVDVLDGHLLLALAAMAVECFQ